MEGRREHGLKKLTSDWLQKILPNPSKSAIVIGRELGLIADKKLKKALKFHLQKTSSTRYSLKLLDELEHTINLIEQFNEIGIALPKTNFRCISVFRYSIVSEVEEDFISILLFWTREEIQKP